MKLVGRKILYDYKEKHSDSKLHIASWEAEVEEAQWNTPHELKLRYPKASILGNLRVVFDICGNRYRLLTIVNYKNQIVFVEKIGTHKEYDKWKLG
ncbi:MAG: type II toxin-antitoxin system HigB family toxin [Candidatus Pacebacteria bacterium]|nr:type II toxin-antitoxin system HigB family toxin [Candidatus Paceibacterota bacterium]